MFSEWLSLLCFVVFKKRRSEVDENLQFHIERQTESNLASGMSIDEARRQAAIAFGEREHTRSSAEKHSPIGPWNCYCGMFDSAYVVFCATWALP